MPMTAAARGESLPGAVSLSAGAAYFCFEWNAENQLARVLSNGSEVARFKYDPLGRRVEKVAGSVTTTWAYDEQKILRETSGAATQKYIHGPGIDEPLAQEDGAGTVTYVHADALGSIVKTTNSAGGVVSSRRYDSFGNLELGAANPAFTGREWDNETGLYYYRARYYDPKVGRFISEDPIPMWSLPNLYAYVENSPAEYTDPLGLMKIKVNGGVVPSGPLLMNLRCLEECLGFDLEVRISATTGGTHKRPEHGAGVAADFLVVPRDPFITPNQQSPASISVSVPKKEVLCCARACSFQYAAWEVPKKGSLATAEHFHVQVPPWPGIPEGRPTQQQCCTP